MPYRAMFCTLHVHAGLRSMLQAWPGCAGQQQGNVSGGKLHAVPVCVSPAVHGNSLAAFESDEISGLIRVPVNADAYGIYLYLQVQAISSQ